MQIEYQYNNAASIKRVFIIFMVAWSTLLIISTDMSYALFDIIDDLNDWLKGLLLDFVETQLEGFTKIMQQISASDIMTNGFKLLLGKGVGFYTLIQGLHQTMVIPLAHSILALVMLVQIVKISQRIDATQTMPAVKDVMILTVFFVIFTWLINNSLELCAAIYDSINEMAKYLTSSGSVKSNIKIDRPSDLSNVSYGIIITCIIFSAISFFI